MTDDVQEGPEWPRGSWLTKTEVEIIALALGGWGHHIRVEHLLDSDRAGADAESLALRTCAAAPGLTREHVLGLVARALRARGKL